MNQNKHYIQHKNLKTNADSQKTTSSIILVNKITILVNKIIILVNIDDYYGIRAICIPFVKPVYLTCKKKFLLAPFYKTDQRRVQIVPNFSRLLCFIFNLLEIVFCSCLMCVTIIIQS